MEIVQERLEREYDLDILATAPSVQYEIVKRNGDIIRIDSPAMLPDPSEYEEIREPWMKIQIYVPQEYIGAVMDLVINKRGEYITTEYLDKTRVTLHYYIPLAEVIVDFFDRLKSANSRLCQS
jgi:GTP-binding protein LepA